MGVAALGCYLDDNSRCVETTYIFWGYITLLTITLIPIIFIVAQMLYERMINMRYLEWRGVITHRSDTQRYAENIIDVAKVSAKSEGTAGMDNYSPSISQSSAKETPATASEADAIIQSITLGEWE